MRSYKDLSKVNMKEYAELFAKIYIEKVNKLDGVFVAESVKVKKIVINGASNCKFDLEIRHTDKKTSVAYDETLTFDTIFYDYSAKTTCEEGVCSLTSRDFDEIYYEFMIGLHPTFADDRTEHLKEEKKRLLDMEKQKYEQQVKKINSEYDASMDFIKSKQEELHPHVNP